MTRRLVRTGGLPAGLVSREIELNRDNFIEPFDKMFDNVMFAMFPDIRNVLGIEPFGKTSYPKVNVISFEDRIEIEAEIAGYNKDDISVFVEDDVLSITGKTSKAAEQTDKSVYLLRELKRSSFSRSFRLADQLDSDKIDASFNNGLLTLTIPRKKPVEPEVKVNKVPIK
jgi:HSP20 family protein